MNLTEELAAFPLHTVDTRLGRISYRRAGSAGAALVLLHGIGSGAASWLRQLQTLGPTHTVLAWNAPGYGDSSPLPMAIPTASDYAARILAWLDALQLERVTLVGHSLGALMAGAASRIGPQRVERLILLAPAGGYGKAAAAVRESKLRDRLANLHALRPAGMAEKRAAAMLAPTAAPALVQFVKNVMAQIDPAGYTQACQMLMQGDLASDLAAAQCPVLVASGNADMVTPPAACANLAAAAGTTLIDLGPVGHLCTLEAAVAVNALISRSGA